MAEQIPVESRLGTSRGRTIRLLAASLALASAAAALVSWRAGPSSAPGRSVHPLDESSAYANTRAGVRYVGDSACIRCHAEIAATYHQHPMGRSLAPIAAAPAPSTGEAGGRPLFVAQGFEYSIATRDGHVIHQETRRDSSGRIIVRNEAEVQFVLGSGSQGFSYLIDRDGFLFQSPITWYARQRRWDLAPGYRKGNPHFDRPVVSTCLYCHANRVEPAAGTVNRYQPPIFRGHAIGCERCHGPGELHVRRPELVDGRDRTIINPADLEPALRDAVCEQCHLMGDHRVLKRDRRDEDFRPGLRFDRVWSVFVRPAGKGADRFVGQVERMHASRCFRASRGRLGCISCHDPHQDPAPAERVSYYRERCLECHADRGCRLAAAVRLERSRDDDCTACHMPRLGDSDIVHAAATDHRIPRQAGGEVPSWSDTEKPLPDERPLVLFHRELMNERERAEAERDLGVALGDGEPHPGDAALALPLLEAALTARPDDVAAWESKGNALSLLGRTQEALAAFQAALDRDPGRESALAGAASLALQARQYDDAIAYWRRAIAINPWRADYRAELAPVYFQSGDRSAAAAACRDALRLNPADTLSRTLLVRCYLRLGNVAAARGEFQTLLALDPPFREQLLRWFAPLNRSTQ